MATPSAEAPRWMPSWNAFWSRPLADELTEFRELVERDDRVTQALAPTRAGALLVVKHP